MNFVLCILFWILYFFCQQRATMSGFRLSSGDRDFNNRVDGLFSCLDEVATDLPAGGLVFDATPGKRQLLDAVADDDRAATYTSTGFRSSQALDVKSGKFITPNDVTSSGSFITPTHRNIPHKKFKSGHSPKNTPGYVAAPDKWTKYSMKDTEIMNDAQNKRAALQLLADLKQKKENNEPKDELCEDSGKIIFKKPRKNKQLIIEEDAMDESGSSNYISEDFGGPRKVMMAEYVVGTKKLKSKKPKPKSTSTVPKTNPNEVKLSYLSFEDDDCE